MSLLACILSGSAVLFSLAIAEAVVEWLITIFYSKSRDGATSNLVASAPSSQSSMMRVLRRTIST